MQALKITSILLLYPQDRSVFCESILRIKTVCAQSYSEDKLGSILRIENEDDGEMEIAMRFVGDKIFLI